MRTNLNHKYFGVISSSNRLAKKSSKNKKSSHIAELRKKVQNIPDNLHLLYKWWIETRTPDKAWKGKEACEITLNGSPGSGNWAQQHP